MTEDERKQAIRDKLKSLDANERAYVAELAARAQLPRKQRRALEAAERRARRKTLTGRFSDHKPKLAQLGRTNNLPRLQAEKVIEYAPLEESLRELIEALPPVGTSLTQDQTQLLSELVELGLIDYEHPTVIVQRPYNVYEFLTKLEECKQRAAALRVRDITVTLDLDLETEQGRAQARGELQRLGGFKLIEEMLCRT